MFRGRSFGGFLLLMNIMRMGIENLPPVTLVILLACTTLHYNFLNWNLPTIDYACLIPAAVLYAKEYHRLITSAFYHGSDMHLYYNMSSLIIKGRHLERRIGSVQFGVLCAIFTLLSSILEVGASYILYTFIDYPKSMYTRSVGFSGVLFALKVIIHSQSEGASSIMGIIVPSKYVYWIELLLISLIYPNASFLGHLCGILSGLLYVNGYLRPIVDSIVRLISPNSGANITGTGGSWWNRIFSSRGGPSYTYHRGSLNNNDSAQRSPSPYTNEFPEERRARLLYTTQSRGRNY